MLDFRQNLAIFALIFTILRKLNKIIRYEPVVMCMRIVLGNVKNVVKTRFV